MKTQLLQDFNESGSAPAGPPPHDDAGQPKAPAATTAAPSRPAVRERPRREAVHRPAPASTDVPAPPPAPAPEPPTAPAAAEPATLRPRGFAPQPPGFGQPVPGPGDTTAQWSPDNTGGDPDWLTERLARDTAMHDHSEWNGGWTRHLATWGAAGVLLALLAGGGLWLYEQRQVEGALVVVANTNPAPAEAASHTSPAAAAQRLPAIAPVSTSAPVPAAVEPAPRMAITPTNGDGGLGAVGGLGGTSTNAAAGDAREEKTSPVERGAAGPSAAATAGKDTGSAEPDTAAPPPKRQRSQARKRPKAEASAAIPDSGPSARQRREETLMQCRAHGYDDRQCVQRGCEMTRYGFACKG